MHLLRRSLPLLAFLFAAVTFTNAQTSVYAVTNKGAFGTLNLSSGAFSQLGTISVSTAGIAGLGDNLFFAPDSGNTLYVVNANTGNLAAIGNGTITYNDFGGAATGLYGVGTDNNLYSINSVSGASTLIGSLGLSLSGASAVSSNGTTFYLTLDTGSGSVLYSVNTQTGAALKIGNSGVSKIVSMVSANSLLYATNTAGNLYTLNISTGAATLVANTGNDIYGMASPASPSVPLRLSNVTPCRLVDTRSSGPIQGGTFQTFNLPQLAQSGGVGCTPFSLSSAQAYSLNVTLVPVNNHPVGYLTIWPAGEPQPLVSLMNSDGRIKANAAIVPAGTNGAVSVYVTDTANVLIDIDAYFDSASDSQALAFFPLTPCRIVDTRNGDGGILQAGQIRSYTIPTNCGVPSNAQAYSFNVTVLPAAGGLDYLTVWPKGETQPVVSTLNAGTADPAVANAAIVPAGTDNATSFYPHSNNTNLLLDVDGYFAPASSGSGPLSLYTLTPCRILDTRSGIGLFNGTIPVGVVGGPCGVPAASPEGFVLNATVVPGNPPAGFLTLWPEGETQPTVSTLNAYDGAITSNMAIVPAGSGNDSINAFADDSGGGTTQLILDISSYFAPIANVSVISPSTLPSGTVGSNYNYALLATGGVSPYTWTISSGSLPPTLGLSNGGVISGTTTTGGTYNFTVKASDSESPALTATKALQITVNASQGTLAVVTSSLPSATVNTPYDFVLSANGGVLPYTWSISSGNLPSGIGLNGTAGLISGAPGTPGLYDFTVKVTDAQSNTATASLTLSVNTGNSNGTLNGQYAFAFTGYSTGPQFGVIAGSFTADGNGNITGGEVDDNSVGGNPNHLNVTGGSYSIAADGLGSITISTNKGTLGLLVATGTAEEMRVIAMNEGGTSGTWGAGVVRQQNPFDFSLSALAGNWAFGFQGMDVSNEPVAGDGTFALSSSGSISNGAEDINDFGTHTQTTFTGSVTGNPAIDSNGRAVVQYQISGIGTVNLATYVISANETIAIEIDHGGALYVSNGIRQRSTHFSNGSLNGNGVGRGSREAGVGGGNPVSEATTLLLQANGAGSINFTEDVNSGGAVGTGLPQSGTYSVAANSRTVVTLTTGATAVCYLVTTNGGFCINVPSSGFNERGAEVTYFEPQTAGPFGLASVAGEFMGGSLPQYVSGTNSSIDSIFFDGAGNMTFSGYESGPSGVQNQSGSGTYTIDSKGAFTIMSGGTAYAYGYVVGPNMFYLISTDDNPRTLSHVRSSAP